VPIRVHRDTMREEHRGGASERPLGRTSVSPPPVRRRLFDNECSVFRIRFQNLSFARLTRLVSAVRGQKYSNAQSTDCLGAASALAVDGGRGIVRRDGVIELATSSGRVQDQCGLYAAPPVPSQRSKT
jgi:hypothetical protein